MKCAYCNGPCDDRPVQHEACCHTCHALHARKEDNPSFMERIKASLRRNRDILEGLRRNGD